MTSIYVKDIEMAMVILTENQGLFGETITKMFVDHFIQLLAHNRKDNPNIEYFTIDGFNIAVWHIVTDTAPYQLYQNLTYLKEQMSRKVYNG